MSRHTINPVNELSVRHVALGPVARLAASYDVAKDVAFGAVDAVESVVDVDAVVVRMFTPLRRRLTAVSAYSLCKLLKVSAWNVENKTSHFRVVPVDAIERVERRLTLRELKRSSLLTSLRRQFAVEAPAALHKAASHLVWNLNFFVLTAVAHAHHCPAPVSMALVVSNREPSVARADWIRFSDSRAVMNDESIAKVFHSQVFHDLESIEKTEVFNTIFSI